MASNDIDIKGTAPFLLAGSGVHQGPAFDIRDLANIIFYDVVVQRISADTNVTVRIQQSNDGVNWFNPLFTTTISVTAAAPKARNTAGATPTRRFARVTITNNTANPCNVEYSTVRRSNS